MTESTVIRFERPSGFSPDPLTEVIGVGAGEPSGAAARAGAADFLARHERLVDERGRGRVVRHGSLPEREVMTGFGRVPVEVPRVRGRKAGVAGGDRIGFRPSIVPPCLGKAKSGGDPPPRLHPRGIPPGDFGEAPAALPGPDAEGLSSPTVTGPGPRGGRNAGPGESAACQAGVSSTYWRMASVSRPVRTATAGACPR